MNYFLRLLIAADQLLNVLICNGYPDETMSSAAYRMEAQGRFWGFMRPVIDALFAYWQKEHCKNAYEAELRWQQLPKDFGVDANDKTVFLQ